MVPSGDLDVSETHPLVSELSSLRAAVAQFQDEAHNSTIKLQRHSLDSTNAHDRLVQLERENGILKSEIAALRAHPHPDASPQAHPAVTQVQQLTLSLRRLSDKLSLTEEALLTRTAELARAAGEASKAKLVAEGAYELAARTRGREEAGKVREIELEWKVKAAEEAVKMSDLAVNEYADLVRSLEAKAGIRTPAHSRSDSSSTLHDEGAAESSAVATGPQTLAGSLVEGKLGLQRLLSEFSTTTEKLQTELIWLHGELAISEAGCEAERRSAELVRDELTRAQFELEKLKVDDNAAAKIVSRYMQFSQKSTNALQEALITLQARHAATIETLSAQLEMMSSQLESSEGMTERLRYALDELGADILKETYGRRREVALRIRMINREERIHEELERWLLRAEEAFARDTEDCRAVHDRMLTDARVLLSSALDGPSSAEAPSSGSLARIIAAQHAVEFLSDELQSETARRLDLERFVARSDVYDGPMAAAPVLPLPTPESSSQTTKALPSLPQSSPMNIDTSIPSSHEQTRLSPFIVDELSAETSSTLCENSPLESLPARSGNQGGVHSNSDTSLIALPIIEQNDRDVHIPVAVVVSDDATKFGNGDAITPDLPDSETPLLPDMNRESEFPSAEVGPAANFCLPPVELDAAAGPHSCEPEVSGSTPKGVDSKATRAVLSEVVEALPQSLPPEPLASLVIGAELPVVESPTLPAAMVTSSLSPYLPCLLPEAVTESLPETPPNPLLADLLQVHHRYDDLQRAFRDCHLALEALKNTVSSVSPGPVLPNSSSAVRTGSVSHGLLQTALDRLNDYTEDARVELEIRIADEALMARGFEALLSVPGALSSASISSVPLLHIQEDHESTPSQSEVEIQVEAFISGTDPEVQRSQRLLSRKLDDIQHDIAAIKLAVHDTVFVPPSPLTAPATNGGGGGWAAWIGSSPSVPTTPGSAMGLGLGPGPAPTFGNVMTSPRLRHSPSLNFQVQSKKGDPFASLGLRVPMPSYVPQGVSQTVQRSRTVSTMYMLGLGASQPSPKGSFVSAAQSNRNLTPRSNLDMDAQIELWNTTEDDSDVE